VKFFETIKIENGRAKHLTYHNERLNRTLKAHYPKAAPIDLTQCIEPPKEGLWRCKVIYSERVESVEFYPYAPRSIKSFKLIKSDIDYSYKYLDRSAIDALFAQRGTADEIIIVKEGLITDTSIANIALFNGYEWHTPQTPLLPGTTRERLLRAGLLVPKKIYAHEIENYEKIALLNAMIEFHVINEFEVF
jgi:4-amino-4-deoxychorismate lyase